jgi:hypothetical protein
MVSEGLALSMVDGISISMLTALPANIDAETPRLRFTMLDIQIKWRYLSPAWYHLIVRYSLSKIRPAALRIERSVSKIDIHCRDTQYISVS